MVPPAVWLALFVGELLLQAAPHIRTTAYPKLSKRLRDIEPSSFHVCRPVPAPMRARPATLCN
jgi:hypothetical protein